MLTSVLLAEVLLETAAVFEAEHEKTHKPPEHSHKADHDTEIEEPGLPVLFTLYR